MDEAFVRSEALLGESGFARIRRAHVAVFGIGGVGGYAVEALCRTGIGALSLFDGDSISVTNLNRQIIALFSTVGEMKTAVCKRRIADISPDTRVYEHPYFITEENIKDIDFSSFDYVIDAIDDVNGKIAIIRAAKEAGTPVISSMGTGNKLDPLAFRIADIKKTRVCPLARVMRKRLSDAGITGVEVLYSEELPKKPEENGMSFSANERKKSPPASVSFVPSAAGLIIAGKVLRTLAAVPNNE